MTICFLHIRYKDFVPRSNIFYMDGEEHLKVLLKSLNLTLNDYMLRLRFDQKRFVEFMIL